MSKQPVMNTEANKEREREPPYDIIIRINEIQSLFTTRVIKTVYVRTCVVLVLYSYLQGPFSIEFIFVWLITLPYKTKL